MVAPSQHHRCNQQREEQCDQSSLPRFRDKRKKGTRKLTIGAESCWSYAHAVLW